MRDGYLGGTPPRTRSARQVDVLAAFVAAGGSVSEAAARARPRAKVGEVAFGRARTDADVPLPVSRPAMVADALRATSSGIL